MERMLLLGARAQANSRSPLPLRPLGITLRGAFSRQYYCCEWQGKICQGKAYALFNLHDILLHRGKGYQAEYDKTTNKYAEYD